MTRVARGIAALLLLIGLLVGVPVLLVTVSPPWPTTWSPRLLLRPDDGTVLLALLTLTAWSAWAVLALSALAELVTAATRSRVRVRLPGLAAPQRFVGGLVVAVLALAVTPAVPHAGIPLPVAKAQPSHPEAPAETAPPEPTPHAAPSRTDVPPPANPSAVVHEVQPGDDLWSLAEQYYGRGPDWRRIAAANPGRLTGGPDRLEVGWQLQIPAARPSEASAGEGDGVTVRRGDSLSAIAERHLGDQRRWPEVFRTNRALLSDPDDLEVGMRLELPSQPDRRPQDPAASAQRRPVADVEDRVARPGAARPGAPRTAAAPPVRTAQPTAPTAPQTAPAPAPTSEPAQPEPGAGDELPLGGVGGLLAAGLLAGLAVRRRRQLALRPVGRRVVHPDPGTVPLEAALGRRQRPLTLRTLDLALRAVAAACREQQLPLPPLQLVLLAEDRLELRLATPSTTAPVGFVAEEGGAAWVLDGCGAHYLTARPVTDEALRPWPTLVTLGRDAQGRTVLADLEALRLLRLGNEHDLGRRMLDALAVELSFSPWAEEMRLTLLSRQTRLPDALGTHGVERTDDADALLDRLEQRAAEQRRHQPQPVLGQHRLDPDLAEPWAPEVVLVDHPLTAQQTRRLHDLVCHQPYVTTAVVAVGEGDAPWRIVADESAEGEDATARLEPSGLVLVPQALTPSETAGVIALVEATGRADTTAAPWWHPDVAEPEPPPDNVTHLGRRFGGWSAETTGEGDEMAAIKAAAALAAEARVDHPILLLLGPIELVGAAGTPPVRAPKQCLEYLGWLLDHPGRTARDMASALAVAEGTRRSNMSRLRTWLGVDSAGEAYLPDAYTGRIALHPAVSSDWHQVQILTAGGINRAGDAALRAVLSLLRGAPLADAAPGQWHWAEELRTDLISCLRDVGVELAGRALESGDLELARWAAARALVAAPGDELLLAARIRTEHRAGNAAETERLTLQLAGQARRLGVDLDPATVTLLQEVVEGRVRARMA